MGYAPGSVSGSTVSESLNTGLDGWVVIPNGSSGPFVVTSGIAGGADCVTIHNDTCCVVRLVVNTHDEGNQTVLLAAGGAWEHCLAPKRVDTCTAPTVDPAEGDILSVSVEFVDLPTTTGAATAATPAAAPCTDGAVYVSFVER